MDEAQDMTELEARAQSAGPRQETVCAVLMGLVLLAGMAVEQPRNAGWLALFAIALVTTGVVFGSRRRVRRTAAFGPAVALPLRRRGRVMLGIVRGRSDPDPYLLQVQQREIARRHHRHSDSWAWLLLTVAAVVLMVLQPLGVVIVVGVAVVVVSLARAALDVGVRRSATGFAQS